MQLSAPSLAGRLGLAPTPARPRRQRAAAPRAILHERPTSERPTADAGGSQLEQLKSMSVVVADTSDLAELKHYKPQDVTTNPSLVHKAMQMPHYKTYFHSAISAAKKDGTMYQLDSPYADVADRMQVLIGADILGHIPGRISTEVDAHLSYDTMATYDKALRSLDYYARLGVGPERVYIKVASTWEGLRATGMLESQGLRTNCTLLFSTAQAAAAGDAGAALVSPFVGRVRDWYMAARGVTAYPAEEDPGVLSARRVYGYLRRHGYGTGVMAASFRDVGEVRALAGIDFITLSPPLMAELDACAAPLPRALSPSAPSGPCDDARLDLRAGFAFGGAGEGAEGEGEEGEAEGAARAFERAMRGDRMARELLEGGIQAFARDWRRLEAEIGQLVEGGAC